MRESYLSEGLQVLQKPLNFIAFDILHIAYRDLMCTFSRY